MVAIKAVAHFSIPVSDVPKSTQFYTEVVGCRHLSTTPNGHMVFLDAAGTCLILVKRDPPINPVPTIIAAYIMPSRLRTTNTQRHSTIYALMVSRSRLRRTGKAACSTALAPISTIPTARYWSLSI
jgi:catechol-2,3-dioxygenase